MAAREEDTYTPATVPSVVTQVAPASLADSTGTYGPMFRLALPVLVEQFLHMAVGFSDTWLAGHYLPGANFLAAANLTVYFTWLMTELFVFVSIGSTALCARFVGAGDWESACRVTNQSFLVGLVVAPVLTLAGWVFAPQLVSLMSLSGESGEHAVIYLHYVVPVIPFIMAETIGIACLRGVGDTFSGLLAMALVVLVNFAVSWLLVLGVGPLPNWGWHGIALGTACGHVVGGTLVMGFLLAGRSGLRLRASQMRPDWPLIQRLLRIGIPGGVDMMSILLCQLWFVKIINQLGPLAAAAHGITIRIESLAFLPGNAFQVAAATMTGQFLGAGDNQRATRSVLATLSVAGGIMLAMGVVFFVFGETLAGWMVDREKSDVVAAAAPLLRIIAFGMPPLALTMILTGALRGAGDTRWPLVFTLVGFLGVRIPLTYYLAHHLGWGVAGAWYAMVIDLSIRCFFVGGRFWHGGWKRVPV